MRKQTEHGLPGSMPRASEGQRCEGVVKGQPDDFQVEEILGFDPTGAGEHVVLQIRKTGLTTQQVADELRKLARVRPVAVGYCGVKDRNAVTTQWFSVHLPGRAEPEWSGLHSARLQILQATRHARKLKIGSHSGNRFSIRIRSLVGEVDALDQRLETIRRHGFPNYFGIQRFGSQGGNLDQAREFLSGAKKIRGARMRGLLYSTARSWIFNRVLGDRVLRGNWNLCLPGDVMLLDGSGSLFLAQDVDETLIARTRLCDIHPSGPLYGEGGVQSEGLPGRLEGAIIAEESLLAEGLRNSGLQQGRRALRATVETLEWHKEGADTVSLCFDLSPGCYATSLLEEALDTREG